ncbi:hypothetical protein PINS_up012615 [Pythium insidiosum]|nr:hypothetical protein PINS_up012615 [Pythium insidiosum]
MLRRSTRLGAHARLRLAAAAKTQRVVGRHAVVLQTREMGFFSDLKKQFQAELDKNEELKKSFEELEKTKEQIKNVEKAAKEKMQEVSSMTEEAAKSFQEQASAASQKIKDSYTSETAANNSEGTAKPSTDDETASNKEKPTEEENEARSFVKNFFSNIKEKKSKLIKPEWKDEWRAAAKELFGSVDVKTVDEALTSVRTPTVAKQTPTDGDEEQPEYTGTSALVAVKEDETAWQKVSARFREAPIIQGILDAAKRAARTDAGRTVSEKAKQARDKVSDAREDVLEFWETSQNPWVYRLSSIYDGLFGETPMAVAIKEIRRAEPDFILEEWKDKIEAVVLPGVLEAFLRGNSRDLKKWFGEAAYSRINMAIRERKSEGLVMDPNVLSIDNVEVIEATAEDKHAPIILVRFAAQQINCIRNREGEIVDGAEDEVLAYYYIFAFQRDYDDEQEALRWRIVDLHMQRGERFY